MFVHFTRVGNRSDFPLLPPSLYSSASSPISRPVHSLNPPAGGAGGGGAPPEPPTETRTLTLTVGGGLGGLGVGGGGAYPPKFNCFADLVSVIRKLNAL